MSTPDTQEQKQPVAQINNGSFPHPLVWVLVSIAIILTLSMGAFPFAAQKYTTASVNNRLELSTGTSTPSPEPSSLSERTDDLGIRTLPLLSTEAKEGWANDYTGTLQAAGLKIFGNTNQWQAFLDSSASYAKAWSTWSSDDPFPDGDPGPYHLGVPGDMANTAIETLRAEDEQSVLDLIGLLVTSLQPGWNGDNRATMAAILALSDTLAAHYKSCDSQLTRAYVWSLTWRGVVAAKSVGGPPAHPPEAPFSDALAACPNDPTAPIEQFKYLTGNQGFGFMEVASSWWQNQIYAEDETWQDLVTSMENLVASWPDTAASRVSSLNCWI